MVKIIGYGWRDLYHLVKELWNECLKKRGDIPLIIIRYEGKPICPKPNECWVILRCGWKKPVHIAGVTGTVIVPREVIEYLLFADGLGVNHYDAIMIIGEKWEGLEKAVEKLLEALAEGKVIRG